MTSQITTKAAFDHIRYAQLWEDADVLVGALGDGPGKTYVSICSAGDNALALLTLDPAKVIAVDLSAAQIECLKLRIAAIKTLEHAEFLELLGARPSDRRGALLDEVCAKLEPASQELWASERDSVIRYGAGGIGKFERYFRILRTCLVPLVHSQAALDDVFVSREPAARRQFYDERWNNWRWRLLLEVFFSRWTMGRLGRDPAFFDYVEGSVPEHVARRIEHAAVTLDPADNPYLHWILHGTMGRALPLAWRAENYPVIRARIDRIEPYCGAIEDLVAAGTKADGFNLSDIFEYMDPQTFAAVYGRLLDAAKPGARLVYWNMMAPRRVPEPCRHLVETRSDLEETGKAADKAFFYSDFVVEEMRP